MGTGSPNGEFRSVPKYRILDQGRMEVRNPMREPRREEVELVGGVNRIASGTSESNDKNADDALRYFSHSLTHSLIYVLTH